MLTQEYLKEILHYDSDTGLWTWKVDISWRMRVGNVAGTTDKDGYKIIGLNYKQYKSHILAWFYMTGEWPSENIDHEDNDPSNNKWNNLRLGNKSENGMNRTKNKNNKSGFKGVSYYKARNNYSAEITVFGKRHFLGYRDTPEEAYELYKQAAIKYHGEFARF